MIAVWLTVLLSADPQALRMEWKIDGAAREALIHAPTQESASGAPVVLAFHGHGGSMNSAARTFALQKHWPEAIVVYMQGLPTPGKNDPEGKRTGWQHNLGDQNDRDLKFFDAVLATLKEKYKVDDRRIFATGHSNGGLFTYLLWAARPEVFAALAPSAAAGAGKLTALKSCPVLHIAGEKDTTVPFEKQQLTIKAVRSLNGCEDIGKEWAKGCTIYPSKNGAPVVTFIHQGDHKYPEEAPELIVKFFKEHSRSQ